MSLDQDIHDALCADAVIGPAVAHGTSPQGWRVYPGTLKQATAFPAVTYARISTVRNVQRGSYTLSEGYTGLASARYQITAWSDEFGEVESLAAAIVNMIHGLILGGVGHGRAVNRILGEADGYSPERGLYYRHIDAGLWFRDA